jgi:hypothetical protein
MRKYPFIAVVPAVWLVSFAIGRAAYLDISLDSGSNALAWTENAGWLNPRPSHGGVQLRYDGPASHLSGYAWAENIGWVKFGSDAGGPYRNTDANNWGVNMDTNWNLSGYAWSENAGWLSFSTTQSRVTIDALTGCFSGFAWSENVGWMHFTNDVPHYNVRAVIVMATNSVPAWWLAQYGWTNNFDLAALGDADADGMATWQEYHAATDPTNRASFLGITYMARDGSGMNIEWQSVPNRHYDILRATNLLSPNAFAPIQQYIPGIIGTFTDPDAPQNGPCFYRIQVVP